MKNFIKKYWLLIIVVLLACFLRFYKLDSYPAFNADEAAIGYNAYSLIETGRDEHGNVFPIHFRSFNDYKPGLYFYLVIPFVKIFGLNEWAVRSPNALLGVATVLSVYFLVRQLFKNNKYALISGLFIAISPWHIHFSRGGWEVNTATFFITLGIYFYLKFIEKQKFSILTAGIISLVLSLYTYHSARVIVPILMVGMLFIYKKEIFTKRNIKLLGVGIFMFILFVAPLARDLFKGNALTRAAGVGLFADPGPINRINEQRGEHGNINSFASKVMHNKAVNYGLAFLNNWAAHYHGLFLFVSGDDIQRDKVPETGQMYYTDIIFLLIGLFVVAKNFAKNSKSFSLVIYWLIIAPVAAALTFQAPHALRAQNMVIPLSILSAIGASTLIDFAGSKKDKFTVFAIGILLLWGFARYEHMYWVHMAKEYPFSSQYGVKELVSFISHNQKDYKNIVVTDKYDQPYILFLFYLKYPPADFQNDHNLTSRDRFGFSTVREFGAYRFITFTDWESVRNEYPQSLIAGTPDEILPESNIIKRIYGTNGHEYFDIVDN